MDTEPQGPAYDTEHGIAAYLLDLDGLNRLKKDRMEAGYVRKERLHDWMILSHWLTDSCGNFMKTKFLLNHRPTDPPKGLPKVISKDALFGLLTGLSLSSGMNSNIPPAHVACGECRKSWTIDDAHDVRTLESEVVVDCADFVGKTLGEVRARQDALTDAKYVRQPELVIRNERFIDLTPVPNYPSIPKNRNGWVDEIDGVKIEDSYVLQAGDHTFFNRWEYLHVACFDVRKERECREYYGAIFKEAGYVDFAFDLTPNLRCDQKCCMPWVIGHTGFGDITVGWRSSVIAIDWSATGHGFPSLFQAEETTKGPMHVHAHGREAAVTFLARLRGALIAKDVVSGKDRNAEG